MSPLPPPPLVRCCLRQNIETSPCCVNQFFLYPMKIPIDQYFLMDIVHFKVRLRSQTSEPCIIGILSGGGNFKISDILSSRLRSPKFQCETAKPSVANMEVMVCTLCHCLATGLASVVLIIKPSHKVD